jgi:FkbM family methyltransferase
MLCFDVGANIGNWSLANVNKFNKIIAVEASPLVFNKLNNNVNTKKNIITINKAVSEVKGSVDFYEAKNDVFSTTNKDWLCDINNRFYGHPFRIINVPTISLDELIQIYGKPDLIKIDTEGGEYNTIKSLTTKVDYLCFEWASETETINFNCLDYLETLGFTFFYLQMEDNYTFIPNVNNYTDKDSIKNELSKTIKKKDWGMIWCR